MSTFDDLSLVIEYEVGEIKTFCGFIAYQEYALVNIKTLNHVLMVNLWFMVFCFHWEHKMRSAA